MLSSNYEGFRPMLAYNKAFPWDEIRYPVMVSPKLDGVRATVLNAEVMSRQLKRIPNKHVQQMFSHLEGVDGELIVGEANAHNVYNVTESAVMTEAGTPPVAFYAFDLVTLDGVKALERDGELGKRIATLGKESHVHHVPQILCHSREEVEAAEQRFLDWGFEGAIVKSPVGYYKYGRGGKRDQVLLKLKRFLDSEARIVALFEEMENTNVATVSALGYTQRSSHKANQVGKGTLGAIEVVDLENKWRFSIGTGFDAETRRMLWKMGDALIGQIVKYKYFPKGMKDVPRHPVFLGFRRDL